MSSTAALLSLHGVHLVLANQVILQSEDWQIHPKQRIGLLGRNGAGKSTLLQCLQGLIAVDSGQIQRQSGLRVAALAQDVPMDQDASVFAVLLSGLGPLGQLLIDLRKHEAAEDFKQMARCQQSLDDLQAWDTLPKLEMIATKLGLPLDAQMQGLSGGMKRRVLLGAAILTEPDLLILDEPTNHLDLAAIEWLESYLSTYPGALILVTHDRSFLTKVATSIVELDRGRLRQYACDYLSYCDRRDALLEAEQTQHALFDKRLADEEVWIRTGVKARRTRNEGRVRALKAMREEYRQRRVQIKQVDAWDWDVSRSGALVLEAKHLQYQIAGREIIKDFSIVVTRGDKIGIIGPNGCGKTTLLRLLLGDLKPDSGQIRLGTGLEIAYFDQLRQSLDPGQTVMKTVADGAEHVTIQGRSKHVAAYLQEFLFKAEQLNQPVSSLSGGERNRLLLARLFAKPANLLVLDEPSNDLDMDTLALLEARLIDYPGTILLISHDRTFINEVVTNIWIYEADQRFHEYVGSYEDYQHFQATQNKSVLPSKAADRQAPVNTGAKNKLTYNEKRELESLPDLIAKQEAEIQELQSQLMAVDFYQQSADQISTFKQKLQEQEAKLSSLYLRWETLEAKQ